MYKEIVELMDAYDKAILVSGDADFVEVVKTFKELNKKIEIWSFKISLAKQILEEAGEEHIR